MAELRLIPEDGDANKLSDWLVRGCIAVPFFLFGVDKFTHDPHWQQMFAEIGWGMWFRHFTGVVEMAGAVMVMVRRAALAGFALLACTMASAVLIVALVLGRPKESVFPAIILVPVCGVGGVVVAQGAEVK